MLREHAKTDGLSVLSHILITLPAIMAPRFATSRRTEDPATAGVTCVLSGRDGCRSDGEASSMYIVRRGKILGAAP